PSAAPHPHLHSFPTRRSSDLLRVPHVALRAQEGVRRMAAGERGPPFEELVAGAERQATRSHEDEQPTTGPQRRRAQQDLADQDGDRKSTRLNSSHVAISYAVF